SLARPQKRPYARPLPPPPPPFADALRTGFEDTINGPGPWFDQLIDASNKRRKVQPYTANAYVTESDRVLDSLEITDDCQTFEPTAHQYPSSDPQVEDSQTQKKRSNPYYTPISSQISQRERESSRDDEVTSVPDSPTAAAANDEKRDLVSALPDDQRSNSPELPSSLGPSLQPRGVSNSAHILVQPSQSQFPHRAPDKVQKQVSSPGQTSDNPDSRKEPDFSSKSMEVHAGAKPSTQSTHQDQQQPASSQTIIHVALPDAPNALFNTSQGSRAAQPQSPVKPPKPPPSDSKGEGEARRQGRLQRPKSLKSPRALKGTCRIINGRRAKTPSVTGPHDPIETSEGSGQERELLRSAKRSKTTASQDTPNRTAVRPTANSLSPVGRFRLPKVAQPVSFSSVRPEVSRNEETVDAPRNSNPAAAREPGNLEANGKFQAEAVCLPHLAAAEVPIHPSFRLENENVVAENLAENLPAPSQPSCVAFSQEGISHDTDQPPSTQQDVILAQESSANPRVGSSPTSSDKLGVEILEQQLKEVQATRDQAQAEFDRITAQKKKRQESLNSKTAPMSSHIPGAHLAGKEQTPAILAMSEEGLRIFSGDDFQAKRKYAEEELIPARKQYWRNVLAVESARIREEREREAALNKKEKEALAVRKRQARLAREQNDKEERKAIAIRLEEERKREEEREAEEDARREQEELAVTKKAMDAKRTGEKAAQKDHLARETERKEKTSSQSLAKRVEQEDLEAQQQNNSTPLQNQFGGTIVDATRHEGGKVMQPSGQPTRPADQLSLAERSPKARRNAALQVQLANELLKLKQSKKGSTVATSDLAMLVSNTLKSTAHASNLVHNTGSKQSAQKTPRDELQSNTERNAGAGTFVDPTALKAAGYGLSANAPGSTTKPNMSAAAAAAVKAPVTDVAPGVLSRTRQDPQTVSSSPALSCDDSIRGWTMTPAIPTPSMKSNPDSVEAKAARRAASVGKTPMRSALRLTPGVSQRSVSFVDDPAPSLLARLHGVDNAKPTRPVSNGKKGMLYQAAEEAKAREGKTTTPRSSSGLSAPNLVKNPEKKTATTKTATKAKQTKMTQHVHVDRKLKGKAIDSSSPTRTPIKEQIIISSASEASTCYSDESERERNARSGPSSRKKAKGRTSASSVSARANADFQPKGNIIVSSKPEPRTATARGRVDTDGRSPALNLATKAPQAPKITTILQMDGARSSQSARPSDSQSGSQPTSSMSTDDVSNLPPAVAHSEQGRLGQTAGGNKVDKVQAAKLGVDDMRPEAIRVREEERLQHEAAEQLQREHMQALGAESVHVQPSKNVRPAYQMAVPAVRPENEKYRCRVRVNTLTDRTSLSQLRKEQVAKELSRDAAVKRVNVPKPIAQPSMESSSESESESESSYGSTGGSGVQKGFAPKTPKKNRFQGVFKDLFG
ncbi:MAG: hypothetical protein Q9224_004031, partial [Gallowayella concinna]